MNISEQIAKNRIQEKFPGWKFQIISYISTTQPITVKCLCCQQEKTYARIYNLLYKQAPCVCTSDSSQFKSIQQINDIKCFLTNHPDFELVEWTIMNDKKHKPAITIFHKPCGHTFTRRTTVFYKEKKCPYCEGNALPDTVTISARCKEKGYTLLTNYKNLETPVLVRHDKCGFIWNIKPYRFYKELDGTCPQCNRAMSKGERRIMNYLEEKQIHYFREYRFAWQSHKAYRYDFFLPDYNLIIEFNGIQHYEETNFLHSSLKTNQEHDAIKLEEALLNNYNYLIIPYTHYQKIEEILNNWFNDYPKGVNNKCMVIERDVTLK